MTKKILRNIIIYIFMIAILVFAIFPVIYTFTSSFKTNMEIMVNPGKLFPANPTFQNYITACNSEDFQIMKMTLNSLLYTVVNVVISLITTSMAGYVFARGIFKGKKIIFACFVSLMFIKTGGIGIYATFNVLKTLHIQQSLWSLILIHVFSVPIAQIYLVKGYVDTLPTALDEAAKLDGCSFFQTYARIIMPLLKPIMATIAILAFRGSWNEYIMPNIFTLNHPEQMTLMVGLMNLKNSGSAAANWNLMLAGSSIALIPVIVMFAICNRYFVSGLVEGAVKG